MPVQALPEGTFTATYHSRLWESLESLLESGYTGPIILHCDQGRVKKWDHTPRVRYDPARALRLDTGLEPD